MSNGQLPNLGDHSDGAHIIESQEKKEVTANTLLSLIDNSINRFIDVIVSEGAGGNITLTDDQFLGNGLFRLVPESGSPGGPKATFTLTVPQTQSDSTPMLRRFAVLNSTGQKCVVTTGDSPAEEIQIPDSEIRVIHSLGADLVEVARGGVSSQPYDLAFFIPGAPQPAAIGGLHVAVRNVRLPTGAPGGQAYAETPPGSGESDRVFDILHNGGSVGSITFSALGNVGTFSVGGNVDLAIGDRLVIVNPANPSPDIEVSDIADIAITVPLTLL